MFEISLRWLIGGERYGFDSQLFSNEIDLRARKIIARPSGGFF